MMVLMSHLHGRVRLFSASILGTMFAAFGYLAVSVFFFLSGFGLLSGHLEKEEYIQRFPQKRILSYYMTCCGAIILYILHDLLFLGSLNMKQVVFSFLIGQTIVHNGWFLQTLLVLYLIFYISFRYTKNGIAWTSVGVVIYCIICALLGLATFWYEAVPCFSVGLICAKHKERILDFLKNRRKAMITGVVILGSFLLTLLLGNKNIFPEIIRVPIKMCSGICFTLLTIWVLSFVNIVNTVTTFLGKHSLEIYIVQGIFLTHYRPLMHNDWLFIGATIASVLCAAVILRPIFGWLAKLPQKSKREVGKNNGK